MEMTGERVIAADRARVWAALNDPEVLKVCISGCKEMEKTSPTSFTAKLVQKVGPVKANFTGEVELKDVVEGESYRIEGRGKGGAAGAASGGATVKLEDVPEGTKLTYEAEAKITGKIAQLGSRLINGFAKKMADEFFTKFQETVEGSSGAEDAPEQEFAEQAREFASEAEDASKSVAAGLGAAIDDAQDTVKEGIANFEASETGQEIEDTSKEVASNMAEALDSAHEALSDAANDLKETIATAEPGKKSWWKKLCGG